MAAMVGPGGRALGVDASREMVAEARGRAQGSDLPIEFHIGDAHELDLPDSTFDACRAERVFVHLEDPLRAAGEMLRVTRPGGHVVALDADWGTITFDGDDHVLIRQVVQVIASHVRNGWIGRQYFALFKRAGFVDVRITPSTIPFTDLDSLDRVLTVRSSLALARESGVLSESEVHGFLQGMEERDSKGLFFSSMTGFIVSGRRDPDG